MSGKLPPGPRFPRIVTLYLTARHTEGTLEYARKRYGDAFTFRLFGGKAIVFTSDPAGVEAVLRARIADEQDSVAFPLGDLDRLGDAVARDREAQIGRKVVSADEPRAEDAKAVDRQAERRDQREPEKREGEEAREIGARRHGLQNWK